MSIIPPSIIRVYAETLGITNLSEESLVTLSQDLEYRIRELIQVNLFFVRSQCPLTGYRTLVNS